ncbi:MAG: TetR/AcrR family transcriptional regulator [Verrucomicrobiaceae bacterium]|nr:MAG: TetR/AcrR family transcriptional regulator [Verrucomicrobiaceae bacterium]
MGRNRSIDRDKVLDVAEEIVTARGAAALTIAAVAEAAGITKGGVQSCYATKEVMIRAMLERWSADEEARYREELGGKKGVRERVAAHARVTESSGVANERAAGLLIALLQSPQYLDVVQAWYADRMAGLEGDSPVARKCRLAFLAVEGAFFLRYFGMSGVGEKMWADTFADIRKVLGEIR